MKHPRPSQGLIQAGDVQQKLKNLFGIKGQIPSPVLGDQVHPVAIVSDLTELAWNAIAPLRAAGSTSLAVASGAGVKAFISLFNPIGSGILVRVDRIFVGVGAAGDVQLQFANSDPGAVTLASYFLDRRVSGSPTITGVRAATQVGSFGRPFASWQTVAALTSYQIENPQIYLSEGRGVAIMSVTDNIGLPAGGFWWTEGATLPTS